MILRVMAGQGKPRRSTISSSSDEVCGVPLALRGCNKIEVQLWIPGHGPVGIVRVVEAEVEGLVFVNGFVDY